MVTPQGGFFAPSGVAVRFLEKGAAWKDACVITKNPYKTTIKGSSSLSLSFFVAAGLTDTGVLYSPAGCGDDKLKRAKVYGFQVRGIRLV
jgi:hypothetical protein